jgi:hypothetical protein
MGPLPAQNPLVAMSRSCEPVEPLAVSLSKHEPAVRLVIRHAQDERCTSASDRDDYFDFFKSRMITSSASMTSSRLARLFAKLILRLNALVGGR